MNERINQLNREAQAYATRIVGEDEIYFNIWVEMYKVKLAELIVRECAEQIIVKGTDWVDFVPSQTGVRPEYWDMAQQIKQHFGVEE